MTTSNLDIAQLCDLLGINSGEQKKKFYYFLFKLPENKRYKEFSLKKRSGGTRSIHEPIRPLKDWQKKIAEELLPKYYKPKNCVYSYISGRSILGNAQAHQKKKWLFKVDLKDFFPSINFGRVRGLFLKEPFCFPPEIATLVAQICCHDGKLPQGAPTSPIISNIICRRLDRALIDLAKKHKCTYTRYCDDLIFSTHLGRFPKELGRISNTGNCIVGNELKQIITNNGFCINEDKVTLRDRSKRQMVTGLVVNDRPNVSRKYIRAVRSMLYAYQHYGLEGAVKYFFEKGIYKKNRPLSVPLEKQPEKYKLILRGKITYIGYIRGWGDVLYLKMVRKARQIDNAFKFKIEAVKMDVDIFTEGKTDEKHLEAAFKSFREKAKFSNLNLTFLKPPKKDGDEKRGDEANLAHCEALSSNPQSKPTIFLFDSDNDKIIKKVTNEDHPYKDWGNGVYSFVIPQPQHREEKFCIEMLYKDFDLENRDEKDRRLFLREEFDQKTHRHNRKPELNAPECSKETLVIEKVFNNEKVNVALGKDDFANCILNRQLPFDKIDFESFEEIFKIIEKIFNKHYDFPDTDQ